MCFVDIKKEYSQWFLGFGCGYVMALQSDCSKKAQSGHSPMAHQPKHATLMVHLTTDLKTTSVVKKLIFSVTKKILFSGLGVLDVIVSCHDTQNAPWGGQSGFFSHGSPATKVGDADDTHHH